MQIINTTFSESVVFNYKMYPFVYKMYFATIKKTLSASEHSWAKFEQKASSANLKKLTQTTHNHNIIIYGTVLGNCALMNRTK